MTHNEQSSKISAVAQQLEQRHKQLIQNERWIALGRVVAAISHDITNHMQAAQGALILAAEEPSLSEDMQAYLDLSLQELHRVSAYLQRLRRVYHPQTDTLEMVSVPDLLAEIRDLTSGAAAGSGVEVETFAASSLSPLRCQAGQLEFILLGIVLNLTNLLAAGGPARVRLEASSSVSGMHFEISTCSPLASWVWSDPDEGSLELALALSPFREVVTALKGELGFSCSDSGLKVWISLPAVPEEAQ